MKLLLSLILIITITGPELVCLGDKVYYVSPQNEYPVLIVGEDGEPMKCEDVEQHGGGGVNDKV